MTSRLLTALTALDAVAKEVARSRRAIVAAGQAEDLKARAALLDKAAAAVLLAGDGVRAVESDLFALGAGGVR